MLYFNVERLRTKYVELKNKECKDVASGSIWDILRQECDRDKKMFGLLLARFLDRGMKSDKASKILLDFYKAELLDIHRMKSDIKSGENSKTFRILSDNKVSRKFGEQSQDVYDIFKELVKLIDYLFDRYKGDLDILYKSILAESKKVDVSIREKYIVYSLLLELSSLPGFGEKQASLLLRELADSGVWNVNKEFVPISIDRHVRRFFENLFDDTGFPKKPQDWQILLLAELMAIVNGTNVADLDYLIWCTQRARKT